MHEQFEEGRVVVPVPLGPQLADQGLPVRGRVAFQPGLDEFPHPPGVGSTGSVQVTESRLMRLCRVGVVPGERIEEGHEEPRQTWQSAAPRMRSVWCNPGVSALGTNINCA